jgi:DDE superfamily endonuclease
MVRWMATFMAYVEQVLVPTLTKGDIVFMDNLRTHKIDGVSEAIAAIGATVRYLPAHSPRPQPNRDGFLKTQSRAAQKCQVHREGTLPANRKTRKIVRSRPVRQLHPPSEDIDDDLHQPESAFSSALIVIPPALVVRLRHAPRLY